MPGTRAHTVQSPLAVCLQIQGDANCGPIHNIYVGPFKHLGRIPPMLTNARLSRHNPLPLPSFVPRSLWSYSSPCRHDQCRPDCCTYPQLVLSWGVKCPRQQTTKGPNQMLRNRHRTPHHPQPPTAILQGEKTCSVTFHQKMSHGNSSQLTAPCQSTTAVGVYLIAAGLTHESGTL